MSIEQKPGRAALGAAAALTWGELTPVGQPANVVRFVLADRVLTVVASDIRRWEQIAGEPENLLIHVGREIVLVEGRNLAPVRAALDFGRLNELRPNHERPSSQPGPWIQRITIEPA